MQLNCLLVFWHCGVMKTIAVAHVNPIFNFRLALKLTQKIFALTGESKNGLAVVWSVYFLMLGLENVEVAEAIIFVSSCF